MDIQPENFNEIFEENNKLSNEELNLLKKMSLDKDFTIDCFRNNGNEIKDILKNEVEAYFQRSNNQDSKDWINSMYDRVISFLDSEEANEVINPTNDKVSEVLDEHKFEKNQVDDVFQKIEQYNGFKYIDKSDIYSLIYWESYFDKDAESNTGSIGLMQLTTNPIRDMKKNIYFYDESFLKEQLGIDSEQDLNRYMYDSTRMNVENNVSLGMAYLQRLEGIDRVRRSHQDWFQNGIQHYKNNIANVVSEYLEKKGINAKENQIKNLISQLSEDENLREKYEVFRKYNGDRNIYSYEGEEIRHRNYYAIILLYLSENVFS